MVSVLSLFNARALKTVFFLARAWLVAKRAPLSQYRLDQTGTIDQTWTNDQTGTIDQTGTHPFKPLDQTGTIDQTGTHPFAPQPCLSIQAELQQPFHLEQSYNVTARQNYSNPLSQKGVSTKQGTTVLAAGYRLIKLLLADCYSRYLRTVTAVAYRLLQPLLTDCYSRYLRTVTAAAYRLL